jgi:hypothetical protein
MFPSSLLSSSSKGVSLSVNDDVDASLHQPMIILANSKFPKLQLERIAFSINTASQGPNKRLDNIRHIIDQLKEYGVDRYDIYVFDDDGPRGYQPDQALVSLCSETGVRLKYSHIPRQDDPAGLPDYHGSKHWHFVFDTILQPHMNDIIDGREVTTHGYDYGVYFAEDADISQALPYYFHDITLAMEKDRTIVGASAMNVNAYQATSGIYVNQPNAEDSVLPLLPYRRANHLISSSAFMLSADAYNKHFRQNWMTDGSKGWVCICITTLALARSAIVY